jgi:hypothetical protein
MCKLGRERAGPRPEVENEITFTDAGPPDKVGGKARAKEVLATRR